MSCPQKTLSTRRTPVVGGLAALLLAGCASYPERQAEALDDLQGGRFEAAASALGDNTEGFLAAVEPATVRFVAGDWEAAKTEFLRAAAMADAFERGAPVDVAGLAEGVGTLLFNETAGTYEGEGFEHVQVHAMLALSFLALGDLEGALVEARRANQRLEREEELYDADYEAGGLGHFVSALAYELRGELDDAVIDYRRMDEKGLAPDLVLPELGRLARATRRDDLIPDLERRLGELPEVPADAARVVMICGVGLAPFKVEESFQLATPNGVVAFAVPDYAERNQPVDAVDLVVVNHGHRARSAVVERVGTVARLNLADRIALLATKSAARAGARFAAAKSLRDDDNYFGAFLVDVFAVASERADLRSWLTLPDTWQVAQVFVPPGVVELSVEALGGEAADFAPIALAPGETALVLARTIDRTLHAHLVGGATVPAGTP